MVYTSNYVILVSSPLYGPSNAIALRYWLLGKKVWWPFRDRYIQKDCIWSIPTRKQQHDKLLSTTELNIAYIMFPLLYRTMITLPFSCLSDLTTSTISSQKQQSGKWIVGLTQQRQRQFMATITGRSAQSPTNDVAKTLRNRVLIFAWIRSFHPITKQSTDAQQEIVNSTKYNEQDMPRKSS